MDAPPIRPGEVVGGAPERADASLLHWPHPHSLSVARGLLQGYLAGMSRRGGSHLPKIARLMITHQDDAIKQKRWPIFDGE